MTVTNLLRVLVAFALATAASIVEAQEASAVPAGTSVQNATASAVTSDNARTEILPLQKRNSRYQLCKSDVVQLTFPITPEFNQSVTVQPDGYITLLGLGDVHVEGQSVPELRQTLTDAYSKILHDPVISIELKDFEKPYFIAAGQLGKPGKYDLRGDTTVTEAVAIAGGFNDASKHSQVLLFRRVSNDWVEARKIDVKKMFKDGKLTEDVHLQPGDMLFVPKNVMSKISRFLPYPSMGLALSGGAF